MQQHQVHNFIFSFSATVYGEENDVPYVENMKLGTPSSPYGASKVMVERVLADVALSDANFRAVSLRYFNPIGPMRVAQERKIQKGSLTIYYLMLLKLRWVNVTNLAFLVVTTLLNTVGLQRGRRVLKKFIKFTLKAL
jgi:UDP-glucose 4-epimerase